MLQITVRHSTSNTKYSQINQHLSRSINICALLISNTLKRSMYGQKKKINTKNCNKIFRVKSNYKQHPEGKMFKTKLLFFFGTLPERLHP